MTKLVLTNTDKNVILDLDNEGRTIMKRREMTDEQLREAVYSDTIFTVVELRELLGLSQVKFGSKYSIPMRTIQSWEAGERVAPEYVVLLLNRVVKDDIKHELRYGKKASK